MGIMVIIGIACAAGLVAGWCGLAMPDLAWELLWAGAIAGFTGALAAWREKRWISLVRKLKRILKSWE